MSKDNTDNEFIIKFNNKLIEFERKIEEENYDAFEDGFVEEFSNLNDEAQELYHECYDDEQKQIVDSYFKRLDIIDEKQHMDDYMFPNRTKTNNLDEDLDDGFSTDKYFGLE